MVSCRCHDMPVRSRIAHFPFHSSPGADAVAKVSYGVCIRSQTGVGCWRRRGGGSGDERG